MFSSKSFTDLALTPAVHVELVLSGERQGSIFIIHVWMSIPLQFVAKAALFPLSGFSILVKIQQTQLLFTFYITLKFFHI